MAYRFFSVPAHLISNYPERLKPDAVLEPALPQLDEAAERALVGAEYRDMKARDRLRSVLTSDTATKLAPPAEGFGPSAYFAQPPGDLPALLRLADQLEKLARDESGERALVWRCDCGTRYAVPVALVRPVSIRCEKCGNTVDLIASRSLGEENLMDPFQGAINGARKQLAEFFRESMARGWPVLVSATER